MNPEQTVNNRHLPTIAELAPYVRAGFAWLTNHPGADPQFGDTPADANTDANEFAEAMFNAGPGGWTPTVFALAVNHARYAYRVGWKEYGRVLEQGGALNRAARRAK